MTLVIVYLYTSAIYNSNSIIKIMSRNNITNIVSTMNTKSKTIFINPDNSSYTDINPNNSDSPVNGTKQHVENIEEPAELSLETRPRNNSVISLTTDQAWERELRSNANMKLRHEKTEVVTESVIREQTVVCAEVERVGQDWHSIKVARGFTVKLSAFWAMMETRLPRSLHLLYIIVVMLLFVSFYLWYFIDHLTEGHNTFNVTLVLLTILALTYSTSLGIQIYYLYKAYPITRTLAVFNDSVNMLYCSVSIYATVIAKAYEEGCYWVFIFSIAVTMILYVICLALWIILGSFLLLSLLVECLIRSFKGKLNCPHIEQKKQKLRYRLYSASHKHAIGASQCAICLGEYTPTETGLCISQCRSNHVFHEKCLLEWLQTKLLCPICRGQINLRSD